MTELTDDNTAKYVVSLYQDIDDYLDFKSVINLGMTVTSKEIPFDKAMIFSWIREERESGRKH